MSIYKKNNFIPGYFYYGRKLTDKPFLTNVTVYDRKINPIPKNSSCYAYVYGKVNQGDYLSTYYLKGILFKTNLLEPSVALAMEDKNQEEVGLLHVKIL